MVIYKIDDDRRLIIEDNALNKLFKYCQNDSKNERGGLLLGKIREDLSEYIVVDISEPCKRDKSGRYYFVRDKKNAQEVLNKFWKSSQGEINYLGEWHTHPETNPLPSPTDRKLIDDCLSTIKNAPDIIFLIIVGTDRSLYLGYKSKMMFKLEQLYMEK